MNTGLHRPELTITPYQHSGAVSAGFVGRKRSPNPAALLLSVIITGAFIGAMFLLSGVAERVRPAQEALTVIALAPILPDVSDPPSSRPRTIAPAPALPVLLPTAIDLAPVVPQVPVPDVGLKPIGEPNSNGDLAQGPVGAGGAGGDGVAGNGSGGAGSGMGKGSKLIASWAPSMDFSQNHRYYPPAARRAGIEGAVLLDCFVLPRDRVQDCKVLAEKPSGYGFGEAALRTEPGLRIRVHNQAGRRIYNQQVNVISYFVLPKSDDRKAKAESKTEDGTEAQ